jgi:hypothetical protein
MGGCNKHQPRGVKKMKSVKNLLTIATVLLSTALFAGCEKRVDTPNGELPSAYVPYAQKYVGTYEGQFKGVPARLMLSLNGNFPSLSIVTARGDFLGEMINRDCQASIGGLTKAISEGKKEDFQLTGLEFGLFPNLCQRDVDGRYIELRFEEKNGVVEVSAQVLHYTTESTTCRSYRDPDGGSDFDCTDHTHYHFLDGEFRKQ